MSLIASWICNSPNYRCVVLTQSLDLLRASWVYARISLPCGLGSGWFCISSLPTPCSDYCGGWPSTLYLWASPLMEPKVPISPQSLLFPDPLPPAPGSTLIYWGGIKTYVVFCLGPYYYGCCGSWTGYTGTAIPTRSMNQEKGWLTNFSLYSGFTPPSSTAGM